MYDINTNDSLTKIPIPAILILGLGENCNKSDIQSEICEKMENLEYKVSKIHPLPDLEDLPLWKKILYYNKYFNDIIDKENSDVLIVSAPGGIMPISDTNHEFFGENAIAISRALKADISILSIYNGYNSSFSKKTFESLSNYCKYALEADVDYFHISNTQLIFEQDRRSIGFLETNCIDNLKIIKNLGINIFNIYDENTKNEIFEKIIYELQDNPEII